MRNEHVKAITLKSGKELAEPEQPKETPSIKAKALKGKKYETSIRHDRGERNEEKAPVSIMPMTLPFLTYRG